MALDDPTRSSPLDGIAESAVPTEAPISPHQPWTAHLPDPLRAVAHQWWKVFAFIVIGNYVPGLILSLVQNGWKGLLVQFTSWGLLAPVEHANPPLFWAVAGLLALLALAGLIEEQAEQHAKLAEQDYMRRLVRNASQEAGSAATAAETLSGRVKRL